MKKIQTAAELKGHIRILEQQTSILEDRVKERFDAGVERLRPLNLVKQALPVLANIPFVKSSLINTALGLGLGYIAKRIIGRKSKKKNSKDQSSSASSNGEKKRGWFKKSA